jgi:hypothetical protein
MLPDILRKTTFLTVPRQRPLTLLVESSMWMYGALVSDTDREKPMYLEKNCTSVTGFFRRTSGFLCQSNSITLHVQELFCAKFLRYPTEHCFRSNQASSVCHPVKSSLNTKKSTEHWCNDTDRWKAKYSKKTCPSATQSARNLRGTCLPQKPNLRGLKGRQLTTQVTVYSLCGLEWR